MDSLAVKDRKPWFLVEVNVSETDLSPFLAHFQAHSKAAHAFQLVVKLAYEQADCFPLRRAVVVPARTLLSQLL